MREFRAGLVELRLESTMIVTYQLRHSGPSIELASGARTLMEVHNRGRWASHRSMNRYERHGRMNQDWSRLSAKQRDVFTVCETHLEALFRRAPVLVHLADLA